jgi:hypothetical protein
LVVATDVDVRLLTPLEAKACGSWRALLADCTSFPIASSRHAVYRDAMQAWVEVLASTGTDYDWSRTFPSPLSRHGYRDVGALVASPPPSVSSTIPGSGT